MKTVWKFELTINNEVEITMPRFARILHIDTQGLTRPFFRVLVWALVDPTELTETVKFRIAGTGHEIHNENNLSYIGTVMFLDGALVFHVFKYTK